MRLSEQDAKARVAKGAVMLDAQIPGWASMLDLSSLDLSSGCLCVMGQLSALEQAVPKFWRTGPWETARAHGLVTDHKDGGGWDDDDRRYHLLQDAWIAAIADRLIPPAPSERPRASRADGISGDTRQQTDRRT